MEILKGKKILFIAPKFYSYHNEIIDFMESNGAKVTFFAEDIYTPLYRFCNRIFPKFATYIKKQYINRIIDDTYENNYALVFVIRGGILSPSVLEQIKTNLPNSKYIMYQWDSNNQSKYENIIKYFDIVKTFDKEDAKKYNIEYLPLYYSKEYEQLKICKKEKKYDIVFFGAYHSNRLDIIKYIEYFSIENNLNFKYHLYITKMGLFRLVFMGIIKISDLTYLKTYKVSRKKILDTYRYSFSVLDIELNIQNGLTMRTFEALGSNLKLLTTNSNIINEPVYNQNNILIIDTDRPNIELNFFDTDFKDDEILKNYSFEKWINNLLGGTTK